MLHIFPSFTICRCLYNKICSLMLSRVQLFATPWTAYIYLSDLSFCFLCFHYSMAFYMLLFLILKSHSNSCYSSSKCNVHAFVGCSQFHYFIFIFQQSMIWLSMTSFSFIPPVAFLGSWFYRLIVLFSANLGSFLAIIYSDIYHPYSSYSGTIFLDTRPFDITSHVTETVFIKKKKNTSLSSSNWFISVGLPYPFFCSFHILFIPSSNVFKV